MGASKKYFLYKFTKTSQRLSRIDVHRNILRLWTIKPESGQNANLVVIVDIGGTVKYLI